MKPRPDSAGEILRLLKKLREVQVYRDGKLTGFRRPRTPAPRGMNRKNIARLLRRGRAAWWAAKLDQFYGLSATGLPPGSRIERAIRQSAERREWWKRPCTLREYSLAERALDLDRLPIYVKKPPGDRYAVLPPSPKTRKSSRGHAGRTVSREVRSARKRTLRERAIKLRRQGLTEPQIAERVHRSVRSTHRYLTGR